MGTSSSSKGPEAGVPMVPPWADDPTGNDGGTDQIDGGDGSNEQNNNDNSAPTSIPTSLIAPAARFGSARTNMGSFARNGNRADMQRGVGQYVSKGYGGSSTAVKRFNGTARTAATLAGVLSSKGRETPGVPDLDAARLQGKNANEIMDAVVDAVRPIDGTQDAEASRESIKDALSELLDKQPNANLLELGESARNIVIECFVAADVYRRIFLDIGKKIQDSAPNAATGLKRLRQVKDYVREAVKNSFSNLKSSGIALVNENIASITKQALLATFQVFEGYAT